MQPGNDRATINLLHCLILLWANGIWTIYTHRMRNVDFQRATYLPFLFLEEILPFTIKTYLGQFLNRLVLI